MSKRNPFLLDLPILIASAVIPKIILRDNGKAIILLNDVISDPGNANYFYNIISIVFSKRNTKPTLEYYKKISH